MTNTLLIRRLQWRDSNLRRTVSCLFSAIAILPFAASDGLADDAARVRVETASSSVSRDAFWDAVFERREGWTGADCAGTVDLGDGRMLWLFGDSWIGSIRDGKRLPGARMVNNSIAVHAVDRLSPWTPAQPSAIHFYWGPNDAEGHPTAWAAPTNGAAQDRASPRTREWLWTTGGGIVVPGPGNSRRLVVFFFRVQDNPRGRGVWKFSVVGTAMGIVDNIAEPVEHWKPRLIDVSFSTASDRASKGRAPDEILWGMAASRDPDETNQNSSDVLVFGVRKVSPLDSALVVARVPGQSIEHVETWRFYAGPHRWLPDAASATGVAHGLVSEFSVEPLKHGEQTTWVLVQSEPFLGRRIFVRTAPDPTGPWSGRQIVYEVSDGDRNRSYFTYAAKGHAGLSRSGELLVTYVVNSQRFSDLMTDTTIYHPKFIRLPTKSFFPR